MIELFVGRMLVVLRVPRSLGWPGLVWSGLGLSGCQDTRERWSASLRRNVDGERSMTVGRAVFRRGARDPTRWLAIALRRFVPSDPDRHEAFSSGNNVPKWDGKREKNFSLSSSRILQERWTRRVRRGREKGRGIVVVGESCVKARTRMEGGRSWKCERLESRSSNFCYLVERPALD